MECYDQSFLLLVAHTLKEQFTPFTSWRQLMYSCTLILCIIMTAWAWSVTASAWWPALTGYPSVDGVLACCDGQSLSLVSSSEVSRGLPCVGSRPPASTSASRYQLTVSRVCRSIFDNRVCFCNSLLDNLCDLAVGSQKFWQNLKMYLFDSLLIR